MMVFDLWFFVFIAPAVILALWAQMRVRSAYKKASKVANLRQMSGAEAAKAILNANGLGDIGVEVSQGWLSDHYDPRHKVLRLSPEVYEGRSLASVGIAAHEAGHALQDAQAYGPLVVRNGLVPLASTGSWLSGLLIIAGVILMWTQGVAGPGTLGYSILLAGIGFFALTVVFQVVNLPVEFNASTRARAVLGELGIVTPQEMPMVSKVLSAAAMTYVAATLMAILQLLYWLWRAGLIGGSRN